MKKLTGKRFEIVVDADKFNVKHFQGICTQLDSLVKRWAYILHNKDSRREHYHIYLDFGDTKVSKCFISLWFDVDSVFVEKLKDNVKVKDYLRYVIHYKAQEPYKHHYEPSEVVANFDFKNLIAAS